MGALGGVIFNGHAPGGLLIHTFECFTPTRYVKTGNIRHARAYRVDDLYLIFWLKTVSMFALHGSTMHVTTIGSNCPGISGTVPDS